MNKEIKIFDIDITDEECGMQAISLVQYPAIEVDFLKFEETEKKQLKFNVDNEQQILFGPAIRANVPIYRRNGDYEYYVRFSAEVIEKIMDRYSKQGLWNSVNLQHEEDSFVDGIVLREMFIKDAEKGINPVGFEEVENGSLFVAFHVEDSELWNKLKSDEFKGFSIEIVGDLIEKMGKVEDDNKNEDDEFDKEIAELIGQSC